MRGKALKKNQVDWSVFFKAVVTIALPIALQNFLSTTASMVDTIMIGNIMLLIPGVLLTNSFRDFISGDMISGLLHFSEAIITAVGVAGGFIIAIILTGGSL